MQKIQMTPSPAKVPEQSASDTSPAMADMKIFVKIVAKKDSTEAMVKSLLSRTHVSKPSSYNIQLNDKNTQFYLRYDTKETVQEVIDKVSGEKIHGATFSVELVELEHQESEESSEDEGLKSSHQTSLADTANCENLPPNISEETIRSITEILKNNPTRKRVALNISPKNKKRNKKMKSGSKYMRKSKKHSTSGDSDNTETNNQDNLIEQVKNILSKDPIASGSTIKNAGKPFDPNLGLPAKPSKVLKQKTRSLLKTIQLSDSEEETQSEPKKISKS